jgi:hypothetical protein
MTLYEIEKYFLVLFLCYFQRELNFYFCTQIFKFWVVFRLRFVNSLLPLMIALAMLGEKNTG